ncbi:MAG: hypothetical protein E6K99_07925 [Thaumarchaeota archaeon]|nr:MAG: hypothetical protein E6K99_07925 [Nitrososphaerota archaeon]
MRKPRKPNRAAVIKAYWNPVTNPAAAAAAAFAAPVGAGSVAPATVSSTARPSGNPTRNDVLIRPEASPSSPGLVPAIAAMLRAGKPMLAPKAQRIIPGSIPKYVPVGEI